MSSSPATRPLGTTPRLTAIVLALCWAVVIADGFDVVVFGAVVPTLLADQDLGLNPASLGLLGSMAIIGMFIGSLLSGTLTDRFGRRWMLIASVAWFSVFTGLCAFAPTPEVLGLLRFVAGVALGGVMPTASALTAEYSSERQRNLVYGIMWSGFPLGGILAALAGLVVIPAFGWRGMFALGFAGLVFIVPVAIALLPESAAFLVARGATLRAQALADKHGFALPEVPAVRATRGSVAALFRGGLAPLTVAFWIASFLCLFMIYGLNTWLPGIMQAAGFSLGNALGFLLVYNVGAIIGLVLISYVADRFESKRVVISTFLVAAGAVLLLAIPLPTVALYALLILAGAGALGTQAFINAWVSKASPTSVRGTALGWSLGIGRLGSVLAPTALGILVASGAPVVWSFVAIAAPALVGALVIAVLAPRRRADVREASLAAAQ
ncbi:MFS transporter [Microbacterium sp. RD1]|uniref:MFS transporter n=1 Tax=Microbacterium sp. RD1 TaxID=3457313 RepID=UPI003FA5C8F4